MFKKIHYLRISCKWNRTWRLTREEEKKALKELSGKQAEEET
jgi:hypothetical protein